MTQDQLDALRYAHYELMLLKTNFVRQKEITDKAKRDLKRIELLIEEAQEEVDRVMKGKGVKHEA